VVVRTWVGWTAEEKADEYEAYMHQVALGGYTSVPGNLGVLMLRRPADGGRVEFLMVSLWESMQAIQRFAGDDPAIARFYDRDDEFLVERQWQVSHYDVFGRSGWFDSVQ
jgi:heme-degrading monooxygenase HmoA